MKKLYYKPRHFFQKQQSIVSNFHIRRKKKKAAIDQK